MRVDFLHQRFLKDVESIFCRIVGPLSIILLNLSLSEKYSIKYTFLEADLHALFISYKQVISMLDKSEYDNEIKN